MICEQCTKENKESRVYPGMSYVTAMYCQPFYDAQGNYHNHDNNTRTTGYRCSNDHIWQESYKGTCWCGWRG